MRILIVYVLIFMTSNIFSQNESILKKYENIPATYLDIAQLHILNDLEGLSLRVGMFIDYDISYNHTYDLLTVRVWVGGKSFDNEPDIRAIVNSITIDKWKGYYKDIYEIIELNISDISHKNINVIFTAMPWINVNVKGEYFSAKTYAEFKNGIILE